MRAGTCIRLCFAIVFSLFSLFLCWVAWQSWRGFKRAQNATPFRLPVDLSVRGTQYRGKVEHTFSAGDYALFLRIETTPAFPSWEDAKQALKGAKIATSWRKADGKQEEYVLDEQRDYAIQISEGRFFPAYDLGGVINENGTYFFTMKVNDPAYALKDVPQIAVGYYRICSGCMFLAVTTSMIVAFVCGVIGALLGVPVILRFLRAQRQPAAR